MNPLFVSIIVLLLIQQIKALNDCNCCQNLIKCSKVWKENCSQINVWENIENVVMNVSNNLIVSFDCIIWLYHFNIHSFIYCLFYF
jgi:hypothetical protein